ncbi:MAG: Cation efflux system protein CusB [Phycisphaerales bacterium]|nr:Cation efflux system protein CusB [Phycisphaerales bacterium]
MRKGLLTGLVVILAAAALGAVVAVVARGAGGNKELADGNHSAGDTHKHLWHCGMHPQVIQDHPGDCPICHMALTPIGSDSASAKSGERKVLYWWDPMLGPSSISNHPGKSAMGMDMVPVYADSGGPDVQIDPFVVQNMGVRTAPVTRGALTRTVRTVGSLSLPEPGLHDVSLKVGGWIDKLHADQDGMHVNKGEPLFEIYSPDLQVAEQELISAVKAGKAMGEGVSAALHQESQNMIDSAKRKLRLWDVEEQDIEAIARADQPPRDVVFRSPATGHIEEKMVVQGSNVQAGMKLLRVADHTTMWLDAQVYEEQLPFVRMGAKVLATVDGVPGKTFAGTITFIYPHLDHTTRTLKVRATLDNPEFELKPGMYAQADIITQPVPDTILCPREAVIDTGTRQIAFIAEGNGHFSPRRVRTGLSGDDDQVQIVEGLAPGEMVVTSGQFLMDVESRTIEATQKLSEGATGFAAPGALPTTEPMPAEMQPRPADPKAAATMPMATMPAQTQPANAMTEVPGPLTQVYCPMEKAEWLQIGDAVKNPYKGMQMADCGEIRGKFAAPPTGSPLAAFVNAYLDVARSLEADKLEATALSALHVAADKLPAEKYPALREAAAKLADAKDLKTARAAFKDASDRLAAALREPRK